ncbi:MAG: TonB-dependent receptor [Pirellulales bacterium]
MFDGYSVTFNYSRQKEGSTETRFNNNTPAAVITRREVGEFDVNTFGTVVTLVKDLDQAGKISYGLDYYYDDVDAVKVRTIGSGTATPQFPNNSLYDRAGAYAAWDVPLTERLSAVTGIRYENANAQGTTAIGNTQTFVERSYQDWVASCGLNYQVTDSFALVGGYYEGYRAPNLDDLFADSSFAQGQFQTISSVNVGPQYSETYEVGFKVDTDEFRMQAYQYWNNLNNAILRYPVTNGVFDPTSATVTRANSDAYIYGTELGGEWLLQNYGYQGWSVYGNVWYTYGVDLGTSDTGAERTVQSHSAVDRNPRRPLAGAGGQAVGRYVRLVGRSGGSLCVVEPLGRAVPARRHAGIRHVEHSRRTDVRRSRSAPADFGRRKPDQHVLSGPGFGRRRGGHQRDHRLRVLLVGIREER